MGVLTTVHELNLIEGSIICRIPTFGVESIMMHVSTEQPGVQFLFLVYVASGGVLAVLTGNDLQIS